MTSLPETVETLREAVTQLQAALAPPVSFAAVGRFDPQETVILSTILRWEFAAHEQIHQALYAARYDSDAPDVNNLRVRVHYLRRKLARHGVEIESIWRRGYRMAPADKARLRSLMAGEGVTA